MNSSCVYITLILHNCIIIIIYVSDAFTEQPRTEEKHTSLTAAKDRAQLTATTAMSVVHVALLKSLVDGGPGANR